MFSLKDACLAWLRPHYLYRCMVYFPLKIQLLCLLVFGHEELVVSCDFSPVLRRGMWLGVVSHFLRGVRRDLKTWWCLGVFCSEELIRAADTQRASKEAVGEAERCKNPANAYEKIKGLYLLNPNRNTFRARCPGSERTQTQQQGKSRGCLMAGSWLPTIQGRGRVRIWEWEEDKSKWWGWEEGKGNREEATWR